MSDFKNGDRVRGVIEGTVRHTPNTSDRVCVDSDDERYHFFHAHELTIIEPEYEVGKYYMDDMGRVFRYNGGDWFNTEGHGVYCGDDVPVRPLRKMVPEQSA